MSERIKELMVEAGIYECDDFEPHPAFKKFADLLLQECIGIVSTGGEFASRPKLVEKIQTHFGVVE